MFGYQWCYYKTNNKTYLETPLRHQSYHTAWCFAKGLRLPVISTRLVT